MNPNKAISWYLLGFCLLLIPGNEQESEACLRMATAINPAEANCLGKFAASMGCNITPALLEILLEHTGRNRELLNTFACGLMDAEKYDHLDRIEGWAREAVAGQDGGPAHCHGTLSRALALQGTFAESLEHITFTLADPELIKRDIQEPTDVLTTAAAAGLGRQALDILLASPSLAVLEPLAAGLKLYLGLEVKAPQEVREVGEDVVRRIEHWKKWHTERGTLPGAPGKA